MEDPSDLSKTLLLSVQQRQPGKMSLSWWIQINAKKKKKNGTILSLVLTLSLTGRDEPEAFSSQIPAERLKL